MKTDSKKWSKKQSQWYRSADPDPYQNVTDSQQWLKFLAQLWTGTLRVLTWVASCRLASCAEDRRTSSYPDNLHRSATNMLYKPLFRFRYIYNYTTSMIRTRYSDLRLRMWFRIWILAVISKTQRKIATYLAFNWPPGYETLNWDLRISTVRFTYESETLV